MTEHTLPALTLGRVLDRSAEAFADRPALTAPDGSGMTYAEFKESCDALGRQLIELGVGFGDTVAILAENSPQWGVAYFAVTTMGAVAVPILTEFHPDAVAHIIRHSEAKVVFVSEKLFAKAAEAVYDPAPVFLDIDGFAPLDQGMGKDAFRGLKEAGLRNFRKWKEKALRITHAARKEPAEDDIAAVIYTSGTSGHSKGVVLTHKNIVSNAAAVHDLVKVSFEDRLLSLLPLAHTFECTLGLVLPISIGAQVFYLDKPPTARVLLPALLAVRPTVILAVPLIMEKLFKTNILPKLTGNRFSRLLYGITFFRKIMHRLAGKKLKETFGGSLRLMPIGGAPLATDAERFLAEAGFPYCIGYGMTEASPIISGTGPGKTRLGSAGPPIIGVSLRIADANPQTGEGEIQIKGPNIMRGYFNDPERTAETFTPDGWLRTGDLGLLDEDGYVFIKGRSKNMVLGPSGENIYPEEIESFFFASPYVLEALVYQHAGKLSARVYLDATKLDELFVGLSEQEVEAKTGELLENMRNEVNAKVASFAKVLRVVEQTEPFEKTPTQKIKRYLYVDS